MRKLLVLAAVMAALVVLASASFAFIGPIADDPVAPDPSGPVVETPIAPDANPTQQDRQQLAITAANMDTLGQQAMTASTPEQIAQIGEQVEYETTVINQYLTKREIIRQELTPGQLIGLLKRLGYWGSATWGRSEVEEALNQKILVGRTDGATADSDEWRQWLTREEFAVGLMRTLADAKAFTKNYVNQAIGIHENNPNAHPAMQRALEDRIRQAVSPLWIMMWIILGLIALSLLGWFLWWLICGRHRCYSGGGYATTGVVPPVVPGAGAGTGTSAVPGPPWRNNTGIQYVP